MKNLNICIVTFFPPSRGRLAEYAYYLVNELQRLPKINHIDVLADVNQHHTTMKLGNKIILYRVWKPDNVLSILSILFKIIGLKPDIVHFNLHMAVFGRSRLANFFGLSLPLLSRLLGLRTLVTLHNISEKINVEKCGYKNNFINRRGSFLATKLLTLASGITVNVKSYTKTMRKRYKCESVRWIPHGTWKVSNPSNLNHPTVLYFGHSGPYKDLDLLFEAFQILRRKRKDVKLIVAGSSHPNYPGFLDKYKINSSSAVEFTGYIPEEQIPDLFEKSSVVVLPYHTCTGTSGVAHLAASYGVPMVATDLPEFHELVAEGCGIVLSPHNPQLFAEKVLCVLNNPDVAGKLRESNYNFAKNRTWDKIAKAFELCYLEMIENSTDSSNYSYKTKGGENVRRKAFLRWAAWLRCS